MEKKYLKISELVKSLEEIGYNIVPASDNFNEGFRAGLREAACMLRDESAADVAQVVHARWEVFNSCAAKCSNCGGTVSDTNIWEKRYCPYCGARMDA